MDILLYVALWSTSILCVIVTALPYPERSQIQLCADGCSCTNHIANCSGIHSAYIPALPSDITTILYTHSTLNTVSKNTFKNVKHLEIRNLDISYCVIDDISEDAFSELKYLIGLVIRGVGLSDFSVARPLFNITTLDISDNNFQENYIAQVSNMFPKLSSLIADDNQIRKISFQNISETLKTLSLRGNELTNLDLSCPSGGKYALESLDVSKNFLTDLLEFHTNGHCFPNLSILVLDYLPLRDIQNFTFANLTSLRKLSMDFIGRLQSIELMAFSHPSLEMILVGSAQSFQLGKDSMNLFQNTPNLTNLTTIQLKIPDYNTEYLRNFIAPLKNLRNLTLKFAGISNLPERFLEHAPNLTSLTLIGNLFSKWDNNIFPSSNSLRYIDFGLNHITDINADSFPTRIWNNLLMLDLSHNPFVCSCSLFWFRRKWIPENKAILRQYPDMYYCESPQEMRSRLVDQYNPSAMECLHPLVVMAVVLSVCLLVIIVIGALLYKYRWHIRYYVYLCCVRRGYKRISEEDNFHFDAFVAYNSDDRTWVLTKLMPFLEKQQKFRLCLHDRDFDPGKLIADNIVENMRKSRKLILILSNSFTSNEWCKFELLMAQSRFLEEGPSTLILVMLERVSVHQMSEPLSVLLQHKSTIEWTNDLTGRNLFWNELLSSIN
ncbi:toll-like receptor 1 [Pecten maximus]|uniref:toll-like receptor 1 n=1 Tax=Pecten maximus TaxID=6579 RepID=UPI001458F55D|nr:toll-like receptor 1 [Pecten maximus]